MSGHSKWSTIKRAKGVNDVKRGQLFTKLAREIVIASREGGADAEMNVRLRLAIQKAKDNNMPGDNIERAINRGSGDSGADALQEVVYEGYGPGGAAILLEALTDNTTRTVSEVRNAFSKGGGNMGQPGCVAWNFETMGVVVLEASCNNAEELTLLAIDAGAEDFEEEQETLEVRMSVSSFERVRKALEDANASIIRAEISMTPKATQLLENKQAKQTLKLMDRLEELDDIQRVYTNADFPEEVLSEYDSS
jgi:YebC/PmpR family DNA-binding regulatory protein